MSGIKISPKKVVGYVRVSTDIQVDYGHSLEAQQSTIMDYCIRNNLRFDRFYRDEGLSGKNTDRPAFQEMMNSLTSETIVVSTALSRISRSVKDLIGIAERIKEEGASLILLDLNVDTSSAMGEFMMTLMGATAQLESKQVSERVRAVMQDMSSKGTLRKKPRYGYKVVDHKTIEDEEEQKVIAIIRDLIIERPTISVASIIRVLEGAKIKMRNSKRLYHNKIQDIITNNNLRKVNVPPKEL